MSLLKRKRFSVQEAVQMLCESDDEPFDDSDNDRDSNYEMSECN